MYEVLFMQYSFAFILKQFFSRLLPELLVSFMRRSISTMNIELYSMFSAIDEL